MSHHQWTTYLRLSPAQRHACVVAFPSYFIMAAQIHLPAFQNMPVATIGDEDNPDRTEINGFCMIVDTWSTAVLANLTVFNPNHGFTQVLPGAVAVNADQDACIACLQVLRDHVATLFPLYAQSYAAFAGALAAGNMPPPAPAPAAAPRAPKTKLPETFSGKTSAAAQHFL
jgi:hypothetical protein